MPWDLIRLNSGYYIPSIAFGTWTLGNGQSPIDQVEQALDNGFNHVDTAQSYRNEAEAGTALRESGLTPSDVFITTKYSGTNGLDIDTSIHNSISNLGVDYVDLYLIHAPSLAVPDIPTAWARMEKVQEAGLARSIGVSNFDEKDLQILLASAKIKPTVNQILLHPYVYRQQLPILEYAAANGIVMEAYSALLPITKQSGGPLDAPLNEIASRLGATADQVLLAWTKAKGAVVVTTSSKKARLQGYLAAGDIELTQEDIAAIDTAGALGEKRMDAKLTVRKLAAGALVGAAVFGACSYFNIRIF
ncbi:aldehyde reductase [Paxillus involutus ATCC 200175]|nr:aldehyde reductase [Paxillus involutus ATCC 200175]